MYWLRRVPTETRIVVLVVFLAFFQAILLSIFGLGAIRGERRKAEENLRRDAEGFLQTYLAQRCHNDLQLQAEEACRAAFDRDREEWSDEALPGSGLFLEAFLLRADASILSCDGRALWMPREVAEREEEQARAAYAELTRLYAGSLIGAEEKARRDLEQARRFPFARDAEGTPLALLYAATPLLAGEGSPGRAMLLRIRWVATLLRTSGLGEADDVDRLLRWVETAAGEDAIYRAGRERQERRARVLQALILERPHLAAAVEPELHRNLRASEEHLFYVRPVGPDRQAQVLAVSRARFREFLDERVRDARQRAIPGVEPEVWEPSRSVPADQPRVAMAGLPGWTAAARISRAAVRERAGESERFYWYIIAFSVAGILAGGLLTARVVMREMKLAKLKSGFVSNVSHSLKTPLTSIRMFSEMLRSGKVTEEAERNECLDVIAQETQRLGTLIQQVLDFGRLSARRRPFRWTSGSLEPVVRREEERFRKTTGLGDEEFRVDVAVNLPPATFDAEAMREVVSNLLSNAWKYTPPADRRIELTLGVHRGRLMLAVEDNGPGIPPRERRRIFDQFYRTDDLLTREVEGTGLGLAIVRSIVRAHGGRILVEDSPLGGSRFVVLLPAAQRRAATGDRTPAETSP